MGKDTRAKYGSSFLVMPDSTNRLNPTGGVIWAISTTKTRKMPNQIKSMPAEVTVGSSMPMVSRSEEHTSELQSLMRISYAVFCLKKKKTPPNSAKQTYD